MAKRRFRSITAKPFMGIELYQTMGLPSNRPWSFQGRCMRS